MNVFHGIVLVWVLSPSHIQSFSSFAAHRQSRSRPTSTKVTQLCGAPRKVHQLCAAEIDRGESIDEFEGFNPFHPGSKMQAKSSGIVIGSPRSNNKTPGGRISPRQMKMQELTTELLASAYDPELVRRILQSNEDFLLDQFNNIDAVLEPDSVFHPGMSREERFRRYQGVMTERILSARIPEARYALIALRDFVLSKE